MKMTSNYEVDLQAKVKRMAPEETGLQEVTENWQRWCGRDMARQSVPGTSSGDRKSSITDGDSRVR